MAQDYIGPYTDFGFRRLFGQAPVLTDFFNAVLPELHEAYKKAYEETYTRSRHSEIARNMKQEGFDPAIIAKMTCLSPDEIERLQ